MAINVIRYRSQLYKLEAQVIEKGQEKMNFQHFNAKSHVADIAKEKKVKMDWKFLPHTAYSPDLVPSDYHLSWSLSNHMRGRNIDDNDHLIS
jgi:[histone H3]-lysine36 N-dimethyltransferase SETMAR